MASPSDQENTAAAAAAGGVVSQYFPCIEQPTRVTLHCNGYYLWCKKNGKLICRKKRNEKDEFILKFDDNEGTLSIQHYKYKGIVTVVQMPTKDGKNNNNNEGTQLGIRCKKDDEEDEEQEAANLAAAASNSTDGGDDEDDEEEEEEAEAGAAALANTTTNASNDITTTATNLDMEQAQKWCFIKGAPDSTNANAILLKSLATGMNLGIHEEFQKLFFASDDVSFPNRIYWNVECSTGELCFLSNHSFSSQIQDNKPPTKQLRCDMAGMLSMDTNRKGWEVFRFMESGHGFVKISSWMHSQWLLCSTKDGKVSTCSHAESFRDYRPPEIKGNEKGEGEEEKKEEKESDNKPTEDSSYKCCNWAIEKSPNGDGVIIRSKTHGRLLSIFNNGELRTYDPSDDEKKVAAESASAADAAISPTTSAESNQQMSKQKKSWKESMRSTMDGARKSFTTSGSASSSSGPIIPQAETTVWQLDAAHSQTYYFLSLDMVTEKAKSIGPGLQVTSNLRKNTKIQLIRNSLGITKMKIVGPSADNSNNAKKKGPDQYIACHRDGTVSMVLESEKHDPTIEWVMEKSLNNPGFTAFRSKAYDLYLTSKPIKNGNDDMYDDILQEKEEEEQSSKKKKKSSMSTAAMMDKMNSFIGKDKKEVLEELFATEQSDDRWKLDPCMPRAVSSDKIKAFAIGTTIAVGTTVAMPFALAGVAGIMGAIGAEVGTFTTIVFAGLTGAEAIASVGAIGATAYIVFKPAENSLTDDHKKEEEMEERAWSKRPFSNWRDW